MSADGQKLKISAEFARHLESLGPREKIRAIVMVGPQQHNKNIDRRTTSGRTTIIHAIRCSAEKVLPRIDTVLKRHQGRRLSESVDSLGSIAVETTAAGINALADLEPITVILEDQRLARFDRI